MVCILVTLNHDTVIPVEWVNGHFFKYYKYLVIVHSECHSPPLSHILFWFDLDSCSIHVKELGSWDINFYQKNKVW